jgi:hypothetical protein
VVFLKPSKEANPRQVAVKIKVAHNLFYLIKQERKIGRRILAVFEVKKEILGRVLAADPGANHGG